MVAEAVTGMKAVRTAAFAVVEVGPHVAQGSHEQGVVVPALMRHGQLMQRRLNLVVQHFLLLGAMIHLSCPLEPF